MARKHWIYLAEASICEGQPVAGAANSLATDFTHSQPSAPTSMGLFSGRRRSAKSQPVQPSRTWKLFRLFQTKAAPNLASADVNANRANKQDQFSASNSSYDDMAAGLGAAIARLPVRRPFLSLTNQNFTPEVALSGESQQLMPSALPLCRMEATHNLPSNVGAEERKRAMGRFQRWQQLKPRFNLGPRNQAGGDEDSGGGRGKQQESSDLSSNDGTAQADNIVALPPKYAYIYQDGKFVEREVNRWPKPNRTQPQARYRVLEPYASHYGIRYKRRMNNTEHVLTLRHRLIYQNPIYRLPRRIMEENKYRLMTRHSLKDRFEGGKPTGGPQKIDVGEYELTRMIKKKHEKNNRKIAETVVNSAMAKKGQYS